MVDATANDIVEDDARARSNVVRLVAAQALTGANAAVIFATGSIIGAQLAPEMSLATVPLSMYVLGLAAGTLPTGWIARAYGRRVSFMIGTGCGALTGVLGAVAILYGSFLLFCVATFIGGLYAAVSQSYRFAAADGASAAYRPKAVSWVMAGGVLAGVLGPQLVQWTMDVWQPYLFAFSYVVQAAIALIAMAVLWGVDAPKPKPAERAGGRPLLEIVRQPRFIAAALCGAIAYPMMNLVMTSAPLAMQMCGLSVGDSNFGLQWHIVAMYAPSFVTGSLIAKFGAPRVVAAGLVLEALGASIGLLGVTAPHFWATLFVIGVGWNLAFVGASALVLETHQPNEKNKVQAFNDFIIFGLMALGSFSSGQLLANYGWTTVNLAVFPPVLLGLIVLAITGWSKVRKRVAEAVTELSDRGV
ncbi:Riboflavin transporter RfnT [Rhodopseudomonas palustris]|uniref:MFS permease family n=1 Tax=Rhodopseudomonas palustris (strain ATCC BAA-98 / CGA009) TaxID=258594 RepID=Q6N0G1_RHOPA|nr:MFS transporter [Rhodopseudomonas palustris]OPF95666.1 MFS transporter [Rhodopseudomonas palustris]QQM06379.1 Riboflavin transporter RfnT [Rhodopseudomonas palustris]RJF68785.1 MFS transporter [Rhodopseudomonas palustris]WAB77690.1 MFS transporter [Rhodopseudomonas palustris]WCL95009.1 MFS transporter [Rhodopseudomonas palustris CGA009]